MRNMKFTLIELLTVISIIAILISLLLPTLGEIRKRAVGIQCTANIKTLLQLHLGYTQDHDRLFPAGRVAPNTYGHYWVNVIPLSAAGITAPEGHEYNWKTYGKKLTCGDNSSWWYSEERKTNTVLSYAVNNYASSKAKKIERVKRPSYAGYFTEGYIYYSNNKKFSPPLEAGCAYLNIHGRGITAGFADGHTEYIESEKFRRNDTIRFSYGVYEE